VRSSEVKGRGAVIAREWAGTVRVTGANREVGGVGERREREKVHE
jgi:hypothetical protein